MADGGGRTGRMAGNSTRTDRFSLEHAEDLRGFKCAFGRTEGVSLVDSGVGNLLGYVRLSLPSEYEKRIPHETFKGRLGLEMVCWCSDTPFLRKRTAGSWGLR